MPDTLTSLVPISVIEKLIAAALSKGGDFAEVYLERSRLNSAALEEQKIRTATHSVSLGLGVRVVVGTEVGYAYSDDLDVAALTDAALVAAAIAKGGKPHPPVRVAKGALPDRYPVAVVPDDVLTRAKVELLLRGDRAAHGHDKRISQVIGSFVDLTKEILVANSEGVLAEDRQVMCRLSFTAIADDGKGDRRSGFHGGGGRVPFSYYDQTLTPEAAATEAARMAVAQLGAVSAPAGPQVVVLAPGWSGILLHEAVGHGLEADFIRKGTSLYAGKLGTKVASELVTVVDNAELAHRRGSINIDDEGGVAGEKVLIEKGVLKGYMVDRLAAKGMGIAATGSGRRESYQHAPMPRMTNTYMTAGDDTPEEILASVAHGLYCRAFGGGQVDIANGNFVFEVREGYLIEHGKLTRPVKNATLIGVGPEALQKVTMVGNDFALDPGIGSCGKDGQSVPVGVGMPTVRMDGITVGGTDGG
ncbi:MAG: metalloprotease TldD [Deltaproteobacteria bacterium]|nr:metalloprotease TldD [Deltaproteobacteria bacterium]